MASPGVLGGRGRRSPSSHKSLDLFPPVGLIEGELGKVSAGPVPEEGEVLRRVADHLPLESPDLREVAKPGHPGEGRNHEKSPKKARKGSLEGHELLMPGIKGRGKCPRRAGQARMDGRFP